MLKISFLVGGLGVENKENGLWEVPFLFPMNPLCLVVPNSKSTYQNSELKIIWIITFHTLCRSSYRIFKENI